MPSTHFVPLCLAGLLAPVQPTDPPSQMSSVAHLTCRPRYSVGHAPDFYQVSDSSALRTPDRCLSQLNFKNSSENLIYVAAMRMKCENEMVGRRNALLAIYRLFSSKISRFVLIGRLEAPKTFLCQLECRHQRRFRRLKLLGLLPVSFQFLNSSKWSENRKIPERTDPSVPSPGIVRIRSHRDSLHSGDNIIPSNAGTENLVRVHVKTT